MTTGQYFYLTAEDSAAKSGAGWYTYNSGIYVWAVRIFTRGQGFILNGAYFENAEGDELGSSIMSAGEVKLESKTIEHPCSGQFLRCNYRPVKLDIQKIIPNTPEDADWDLESRGCSIQEISDSGVYTGMTTGQYFYLTAEDSAAKSGAGWYTYNNGAYEWAVREFEPGQGFILNGAYFENAEGDELGSSITIKD